MTTLTKLLPRDARPAQILLKRAKRIALTSAQRLALPHHLDAAGEHLHHALDGHAPIEVGDVLLDERGGFWVTDAAPEALLRVSGDAVALLRTAWALGDAHVRMQAHENGFDVVPDAAVRARLAALGLTLSEITAGFTPDPAQSFVAEQAPHVHGPDCGHDHGHEHVHGHHHHGHDH